ncbi:MAG TPA: hypothetical protein PLF58_12030, partial [Smithella sp.]|nr:hypothetical protein [Smithella sp.]
SRRGLLLWEKAEKEKMTDSKKMQMTKNIFFIKALRVNEFRIHFHIFSVRRIINPKHIQKQDIFGVEDVEKSGKKGTVLFGKKGTVLFNLLID